MSLRSGLRRAIQPFSDFLYRRRLPDAAKAAWQGDDMGLPAEDSGAERAVIEAIEWLLRAQSNSKTADGGVARHYSLVTGWGASYPETTGYIIPTLLAYAAREHDERARDSAQRMLDWLVDIQFADGGFQGGRIDSTPVVPVTFNTGQILLGLAAGVETFGDTYREPMRKAARWLVETLDDDGCWRRYPSPFAKPGEKVYETHVAWGLFEADRVEPGAGYGDAGMRNVAWALLSQRDNGWLDNCCLSDSSRPLTHTLGYALRGILEAHKLRGGDDILAAARKTADGLLSALDHDGYLPGRLNSDWTAAVPWVCLTGSAQVAHCWLMLGELTGDKRYFDAGFAGNRFVRRTMKMDGPDGVRGGVKGSFPVSGDYGHLEYLNWAPKFLIDSCVLESEVRKKHGLPQE